ncbi:MAG: M23 family metallopeptidase [Actinomycetota bacterium]|nr:M23 family metallopeptidase [Actinomycetota bacterium]
MTRPVRTTPTPRRWALALAAGIAVGVVAVGGAPVAQGQSNPPNPILDLLIPTTTAPPPPPPDTTVPAGELGEGSTQAPAGAEDAGDGTAPPPGGIVVPPEAQKIIDSVKRTRASSSEELVAGLQQLVDLGADDATAFRLGMGRFPIAGVARYSHDWLYPRYGPGFRFHLGTDVFAAYGTPVRAPVDGVAQSHNDPLGGLSVRVVMPDRTYFYLAHLSGLVDGFTDGMPVATGDIVGYVGDSGNARGGTPHLHFGVYPKGGAAIDPKPVLDDFIADALANLPTVVEAYRVANPPQPPTPVAVASEEQKRLRPMLATGLLHQKASVGHAPNPASLLLLASAPGRNSAQVLATALQDLGQSLTWPPTTDG